MGDVLKSFQQKSDGTLNTTPTSESLASYSYPGTTPTVSANGTTAGILWALGNSAYNSGRPAVLHAYDATNLGDELYSSAQVGKRDQAAGAVKFTVPTVANGKVYVAGAYELDVYGLLTANIDAGFEQVAVGAGQFRYDPAGSPWYFSGGAGISANASGFTSGNPPAPEGTQVAFLQRTGEFTQIVTDLATGTYVITFDAAQRANFQTSQQDFNVLVDGVVVGTFTPSSASYQSYTTAVFNAALGPHTISFQGLDTRGGDNTAFIDAVAIVDKPLIDDQGFEQISVGNGRFQYDPTGSPWTFSGGAGISGNQSAFTLGNPPAPEGTQVVFLQRTGSFSQSGTGWNAGSYVITFDAAQRGNHQASRQDFSVLVDGAVVGTFTPSGSSYQSCTTSPFTVTTGTHTVKFQGLDSAGGDNTAFIDFVEPVSYAPNVVTPSIADAGFEQVTIGDGQFQYDPMGSPWTFSGNAGISGNYSDFTAYNPLAPEGRQVAFLQETGSFSQTVTGWAAGSYEITFDAAQRGDYQSSHQDFSVLVDGVTVGTFIPSGAFYGSYATAVFTVTAGVHTITFQGLDSAGGDNTTFIDQVSLAQTSAASIADPSFEQVSVGAGHFLYDPTGSPWTFSGGAGISGNSSGFTAGNPPAPDGTQVAFLQQTSSFSQTTTGWAAGSYVITFEAAQRGNHQASRQDFNVLVDGTVVDSFTPSGTSYQSYATAAFTVTAGSHTIAFQGLDSAGGDNTAFIDEVALAQASAASISDPGFEHVSVGAGQFRYDPTGSAWTFTGTAGISGNRSGFTSGNHSAPEGVQVAFLQETSSFSQSVAGWAAGSYTISFQAAQRANYQSSQQDFSVLIDGVVISTFTPPTTSYQGFSTASFTVSAGAHTITFQGLDTAGGDNTAFIDQVAIS
jgi:hypothetical protein